ncbi:MAG: hypothetical protein AAFQ13_05540 [Pseudomonadota bacterium]
MLKEYSTILVVVAVWLLGMALRIAFARGPDPIPYSALIPLDAENLAEGGVVDGYEEITSSIHDSCVDWLPMTQAGERTPEYRIMISGKMYYVYGSPVKDDPWAMAGATLLTVVNNQLEGCPFKVYALSAGNDLGAVRLTDEQFRRAQKYHKRPYDRPYLPTYDPPEYGFPQ